MTWLDTLDWIGYAAVMLGYFCLVRGDRQWGLILTAFGAAALSVFAGMYDHWGMAVGNAIFIGISIYGLVRGTK